MAGIVNDVFTLVNGRLDKLVEKYPIGGGNQLDQISKLYWNSWEELKGEMGTSAGWPWLGEYMIFYTLMHYIKKATGIEFTTNLKESHGSVKVFSGNRKSRNLLLAHNAKLGLIDSKPVRPDVFLLDNDQLVFTIDVKVVFQSAQVMVAKDGGALGKLARTVGDSKWMRHPLGYLISLHEDMPASAQECNVFQKAGVRVVGPRGGSIEEKLGESPFPMTTYDKCIDEILGKLSF